MKRKIMRKLSSQAGESIGETLVALLISALALVMLAGAVTSGMRVVTQSKKVLDGYYTVNNAVAVRETAPPSKDGLTLNDSSGPFTGSLNVSISGLEPSPTATAVIYWKNEQLSNIPVISYALPTPTPVPGT